MLNRLWLVAAFCALSLPLLACDACGCSISQSYTGVMPQLGGHYLGIWWQHQAYRIQTEDAFTGSRQEHQEYFNTIELRGRLQLLPRLQLSAIMPYAQRYRPGEGSGTFLNGLADPVVLLHGVIIDNGDSTAARVQHRLVAGAGVKAPLGQFQQPGPEEVVNPNLQIGTGSWDFLLNASYTLRWGSWGVNTDFTYRYNGESANGYQFGDRISGVASLFRLEQLGQWQLMPNAGLFYERAWLDVENGFFRTNTGGNAMMAALGVESFRSGYNIGLSLNLPVRQNWNGGLLRARPRVALHFNYFL